MGRDDKQRQQAKAKKLARQKAQKAIQKQKNVYRLERAHALNQQWNTWPLWECWESDQLADEKIRFGSLVVTRRVDDSRIAAGIFLIDGTGLGVKSACLKRCGIAEYRDILHQIRGLDGLHTISPEYAKKMIEGVIIFARDLGFKPDKDYLEVSRILEGIDASKCTQTIEFGIDGKPVYVANPYDTELLKERIIKNFEDGNWKNGCDSELPVDPPAD